MHVAIQPFLVNPYTERYLFTVQSCSDGFPSSMLIEKKNHFWFVQNQFFDYFAKNIIALKFHKVL